jgi:hypothetical protein
MVTNGGPLIGWRPHILVQLPPSTAKANARAIEVRHITDILARRTPFAPMGTLGRSLAFWHARGHHDSHTGWVSKTAHPTLGPPVSPP